jgi:hypothetical protein
VDQRGKDNQYENQSHHESFGVSSEKTKLY